MPENAFLPNTKTKIQDLHRSLVESLGNTKIQDPRFPQDSWLKSWKYQDPRSKILARSLVGILDLGSWYFQDFSQESCGNLGSWILENYKIFHKTSVQILDLGLGIGQECILNALNAF